MFVVDWGFRDAVYVWKDIGIKMEMPSLMQKGATQRSTHDSNISRVVTKVKKKLHILYINTLSKIKNIKFEWI